MKLIRGLFIIIALWSIQSAVLARPQVVNVFIWGDYLPQSVIHDFEKETGIHVNYSEYDSNETMYAKLKSSPTVSYDVIVPSDYFVDRMRKQGMLQSFDKSQLPNWKNLNPALLNRPYDPNNQYSVPYLWGTVGIVVNKKYLSPNQVTSWADLWRPQYKNSLEMLDDMRQVFSMALISLGYSVNDSNPQHIEQAYLKLKSLLPNIKLFNSNATHSIYIDEDAWLGINFSGDTYRDAAENSNLVYIYPKEGFVIWIDNMAIPKGAPHLQNAYKFINFILRPENAAKIALAESYVSPNLTAMQKLIPANLRNDPTFNPSQEVLNRGQSLIDLGKANTIYAKYWEKLKVGG
ncbi:MAG: spermidine/putrescine ABC transporter substrate-binding protein [Gammaproteobacteria bacterium]